jgi:hypothetical protein
VVRDNVAGALGKNSKRPIFGGRQFNPIRIDIHDACLKIYGKKADGDPRFASGQAVCIAIFAVPIKMVAVQGLRGYSRTIGLHWPEVANAGD